MSTLEFFEKINAYNTIDDTPVARRSTEPLMESAAWLARLAKERPPVFDPLHDGCFKGETLEPPLNSLLSSARSQFCISDDF